MSTAPESLRQLRQFLASELNVEARNFGIRGVVTARRPWGYHLGRGDIYSDDGMGDRDYSVRYRRDRRGLSSASAGFDIRLPKAQLIRLTHYLVQRASSGTTNPGGPALLVEVLGPNAQGEAKRWARSTGWRPTVARSDQTWHAHLSFYRDTEFVDKRPLFHDFVDYVPPELAQLQADDELDELVPDDGDEAAPANPTMPDDDPRDVRLAEAEDALAALAEATSDYYQHSDDGEGT